MSRRLLPFLVFMLGIAGGIPAWADVPASTLTLAVIGDYGCQAGSNCFASPANELAVAGLVHSWNPDAIVTVGDNSYENGSAAAVAADQGPYVADIAAGKFYPTPGNHDWQNGSIEPSTGFFHRPPHYVAHLGNGLVDLFVTDMNYQDPDGDDAGSWQAGRYRADVQASPAIWKITTGHQAFYSSGQHGTMPYTHWAIVPAIDLFLSGHDHDFEHLVVGGKPFVVDGVGGRNLRPVCRFGCVPGSVWHDDQHFGAVRLTITRAAISVEFVAVGGQVLHSFQVTKASGQGTGSTTPAPEGLPSSPIRAAFYYPWFPEAWSQQGLHPFTRYHPSAGLYDSSAPSLIATHISAMQYGGIQAGIASWWGRGSATDRRVSALLAAAAPKGFRWALLYEAAGRRNPTAAQITSDLRYIRSHYAGQTSYLRVDGRFVVFVYASPKDGCAMAQRWGAAQQLGAYVMLKMFSGSERCAAQPDGWYQYSPDVDSVSVAGSSYTISPGFWKATEQSPRLQRNLDQWTTDIRRMVASGAPFQLISTFNEWGEGTAIESGREWASPSGYGAYLDALHASSTPATRTTPTPVRWQPTRYLIPGLAMLALIVALVLAVAVVPRRLTLTTPGRDSPPPSGGGQDDPVSPSPSGGGKGGGE